MSRKLRLALALVILALSFALLAWGYAPNKRETLIRRVGPDVMQLGAP